MFVLFFFSIIGFFLILFINAYRRRLSRYIIWGFSALQFFFTIFSFTALDGTVVKYQYFLHIFSLQPILGSTCSFALDLLSYGFIFLVNLLMPFCIISGWELKNLNIVGRIFFLLQTVLLFLFLTIDFF
jgi:NADH:ubiquinone oxidoreductase subunit 4 (subunit M)